MRDLLKEYAKKGNVSYTEKHIDLNSKEGRKLLEELGIDKSEFLSRIEKGDTAQIEVIRDGYGNIVEAQHVTKQPKTRRQEMQYTVSPKEGSGWNFKPFSGKIEVEIET